jgi:CheY-like chemotaxis protein
MGIFIYRVDEAGELILIEANPATERIRRRDRDIPIIALTAFAFTDDRERAIQAGCTEHLSKPVRIEELKGVVRRNLG